MDAACVYKILDAQTWERAQAAAAWRGASIDLTDGFIHLSARGQLAGTLRAHFAGRDGLVVAAFDAAALGAALRWEESRGGARFPHLYGPLDMTSALQTWRVDVGADGTLVLPPGLAE
jgi:uncharacterized protein (DUF952 family)